MRRTTRITLWSSPLGHLYRGYDFYSREQCTDTSIGRRHTINDSRKRLQCVINRFVDWAVKNGLLINTSKTYYVNYVKIGAVPYETSYYIGTTQITTKENIFDLGVHFDSNLTFKYHVSYVYNRIRSQTSASIRFSKEIRHPKILSRISRTYIAPITEYAAPVWSNKSKMDEKRLDEAYHTPARLALDTSYPNRAQMVDSYMTYEERLQELRPIPGTVRRRIAGNLQFTKMVKGDVFTVHNDTLVNSITVPLRATRSPPLITTSHFARDSLFFNWINELNRNRHHIFFNDDIKQTREALREYLRE